MPASALSALPLALAHSSLEVVVLASPPVPHEPPQQFSAPHENYATQGRVRYEPAAIERSMESEIGSSEIRTVFMASRIGR